MNQEKLECFHCHRQWEDDLNQRAEEALKLIMGGDENKQFTSITLPCPHCGEFNKFKVDISGTK